MSRRYIRETCPKCGGSGSVDINTEENVNQQTKYTTTCPKCGGKGDIKSKWWIEE